MAKKIAVIGLGILGIGLSRFLAERGAEVIAIDSNMDRIEEVKDHVTVAVAMNATNERSLVSQDLAGVDVAVVCIGENFHANLLATVLLKKIGVRHVVTRASSEIERKILREVGADELIYPEDDLARELAVRLTAESILDMIPLGSGLAAAKMKTPQSLWGKTIRDLQIRNRYGVNLIALYEGESQDDDKDPFPMPETVLQQGQTLLVIGRRENIEKFAMLK